MCSTRMICVAVAITAACPAASRAADELKLAWARTDDSLALTNHGKVVWQFNHGEQHRKPCFHPLATLDGTVLTDFRPSDHLWHRAAWFSLKEIDGLNYWEEDREGVSAGRNETIEVEIQTQGDFSAEIRLRQSYHPPGEPELLGEERLIHVSAPHEDGSYTLDWQHLFTARKSVTVGASAGYAGLSLRLSKQLLNWSFLDSQGQREAQDIHGTGARWLTYKGPLAGGSAGLTVFDHPTNPRHPTKWFIVKDMPYFSPAFVFDGPIALAKDQQLALYYRMKVYGSAPEAKALETDYRAFSQQVSGFKKGSGTVVQSTLPAVPATVPDPFLNFCKAGTMPLLSLRTQCQMLRDTNGLGHRIPQQSSREFVGMRRAARRAWPRRLRAAQPARNRRRVVGRIQACSRWLDATHETPRCECLGLRRRVT